MLKSPEKVSDKIRRGEAIRLRVIRFRVIVAITLGFSSQCNPFETWHSWGVILDLRMKRLASRPRGTYMDATGC